VTDFTFRSTFDVELLDFAGSDESICQAARVSTAGAESLGTKESEGLINFLMKNRHGSPFEHTYFRWRLSAPIFVWREVMRHRIASYNEESGRYKQLEAVFYIPARHRPLRQVGKPGAYLFVPGLEEQHAMVVDKFTKGAKRQYKDYEAMLKAGIAREVARMELPLNIYSSAYVSMNARGLMNFLSLRTRHDDAAFPSFPQWEIEQVADAMERGFEQGMPLTAAAFTANGRVCP
jgi:thymidylate synthase (FAD)